MLFFYIRHGDPIYQPDSLTPLGEYQAEAVKSRLGQFGLDKIYASSSNRAILTATPTAKMLKKEMEILDWCNESHAWHDLTVKNEEGNMVWLYCYNKARIDFVSEDMRALGKKWYEHPKYNDERYKAGTLRIKKETEKLLAAHGYVHDDKRNLYIAENPSDERIALFAHEGFGLMFLSCLLDIPYPEFCTHFTMQHSGMTVIEFPNKKGEVIPTMLQLSNDSHLFAERLPLKYQNRLYF